jgi:Gamma-glutamyl cyclotransferase, AIG2-like
MQPYGSLMDRELLALVIGRATDELRVKAATIHDFVRRRALNESFPVLVPHPGGRVEGVLVRDLRPTSLASSSTKPRTTNARNMH